MNCKQFSSALDRQARDGTWPEGFREEMLEHAKNCSRCRLLLELRGDLQETDADAVLSPELKSAWRRAIRESDMHRAKRAQPALRIAALAAALALIVGGAILSRMSLDRSAPDGTTTAQTAAVPDEAAKEAFSDTGFYEESASVPAEALAAGKSAERNAAALPSFPPVVSASNEAASAPAAAGPVASERFAALLAIAEKLGGTLQNAKDDPSGRTIFLIPSENAAAFEETLRALMPGGEKETDIRDAGSGMTAFVLTLENEDNGGTDP